MSVVDLDQITERLVEVARYLRDEADFNRSWTDGRRGDPLKAGAGYIAARLEVAAERDRWAIAVDRAIALIGSGSARDTSMGARGANEGGGSRAHADPDGPTPEVVERATRAAADYRSQLAMLRADLARLEEIADRHIEAAHYTAAEAVRDLTEIRIVTRRHALDAVTLGPDRQALGRRSR